MWNSEQLKTQLSDLYEVAKEKTWNPSKDIDWRSCSRRDQYPVAGENNPLQGFDEFESLAESDKKRVVWWQHSIEISEILHGEQAALIIAAQLVNCLPTVEGKLLASSQVNDEARHVEFFSRYLRDVAGKIHAPSVELASLIERTVQDPRWDVKFVVCQLLIESLAMSRFQEIKQSTEVPLLRYAIEKIAKDEARHVRFGTAILKDSLQSLPAEEQSVRSEFVLDSLLALANSQNIYTRIARKLGWNVAALRCHLRTYRLKRPELTRSRLRILMLNLDAVGLLTPKTRSRIAEIDPCV